MKPLVIFLGVVGLVCGFYTLKYPDYTYRYRLELTLEVDGKTHTGSSVIEVRWRGGPNIAEGGAYNALGSVRGQAPLIDLGDRGVIIASLGGRSYGTSTVFLCATAFGSDSSLKELPKLPRLTGRRALKPDKWPLLLWLPDRNDPKSVQELIPGLTDRALGPTTFRAASVEITTDSVVVDIDKKFPWYRLWADKYGDRGSVVSRPGEIILAPSSLVGTAS